MIEDHARGGDEVLIVAAGTAWPFYRLTGAYVCQSGRTFRRTRWFGFYSQRSIHGVVAEIEGVIDGIELTEAAAARLSLSTASRDRRLGNVIAAALRSAWKPGELSKIILLSRENDPHTERFNPIEHHGSAAWTMGQRYTRLSRLRGATTTEDLTTEEHRG